jgi:hypothetical protein
MSTSIPEKMKCILVKNGKGTADDLYMGEEQVPTLEKGQVLVKARFSPRAFLKDTADVSE